MNVHANTASQGAHNIAIEFFGDHLDEFRRHLLGQSHAERARSYNICAALVPSPR
jgi:hypothetical protein